jgi:hypothetical protein
MHFMFAHIIRLFTLGFILIPAIVVSQVSDDFTDGDFTSNPIWQGNTPEFIVNIDGQLQLNDLLPSGADTSILTTTFTSISLDDKEWQFWVKQTFAGSANNYGRFWLACDNAEWCRS